VPYVADQEAGDEAADDPDKVPHGFSMRRQALMEGSPPAGQPASKAGGGASRGGRHLILLLTARCAARVLLATRG